MITETVRRPHSIYYNITSSYLSERRAMWRDSQQFDAVLLLLSLTSSMICIGILLFAGTHAGFWSLQALGLETLPTTAWANITFLGDTLTALTIALMFSYRYPNTMMAILMSALVGTLLIHGLKHLFGAPRPPAVLDRELLSVIGPAYKSNSMPSGHTATAFILAGIITRCCHSIYLKVAVIAVAVLVGWSRVSCGVHWPADVAAGAAIGMFSAWCGLRLSDVIRMNTNSYVAITALHLGSAAYLWNYNGDLPGTNTLAQLLCVTSIGLWVISWWRHFAIALNKPSLANRVNNSDANLDAIES